MYVISVCIIARGVFKDTLSYFTLGNDINVGSLVSVPVRNRLETGIVVAVEEAARLKASLKQADFSLRKLEEIKGEPLFLPEFMKAVERTAEYSAGSVGTTLASFVPGAILASRDALAAGAQSARRQPTRQSNLPGERFAFQAETEDRIAEYRGLIRERFAKGESVYLCFPTVGEAEHALELLEKGIRDYAYVFHSMLPKKKLVELWKKALSEKHPILIMGTGTFLSIPRRDIGLYIVEQESSRFYKSNSRPYADVRVLAERLAEESRATLIFGDTVLRTETLYRLEKDELMDASTAQWRQLSGAESTVVDLLGKGEERRPFTVLSPELETLIRVAREREERTFIFANRRGLSPLTLCQDCSAVVTCTQCGAPITLHRTKNGNIFFCHRCGEKRSSEERCKRCTSWNLKTLGIGLDLVEDAIRKTDPKIPLFRIDRDSTLSHKQGKATAEKFYATPGSVLLGTEMALYYLHEKIENTAAAAIDSLFAIPDFRMSERIFGLLITLRGLAEKRFLVQTRNVETSVVTHAASGNIADFYQEELGRRKMFHYPPFSLLVKISCEGKKEAVGAQMDFLKESLKDLDPLVFPAYVATAAGRYQLHALLSLPRETWPDPRVVERLRALPPAFKVNVEPENSL
ncbi:MAG TPA: primosomal protein N' [Candidatus Paceibacterota bacterium]|nr:primosomal protein N' [Candidatus Paceibacterota bacterium]